MSSLVQRLRDLNERFIFQGGSVFAKSLANRIERAESEVLEQARLNGMGSEREAALMARAERAEREAALLKRTVEQLCAENARVWKLIDDAEALIVRQREARERAEQILKSEPDPALLNSMALRYRHDFGLIEDEREREAILTTMRQLWEEVVGLGFYRPNKHG